MITKRISFTGNFRDLIPMGFTFQKLFANNYRSYRFGLESQPTVTEHTFWIWQHYGGYMEIDDLGHRHSATLLEYALNAYIDEPCDFSECYRFVIDRESDVMERDHENVYMQMMVKYHHSESKEEKQKIVDEYYERWRTKTIWGPLFEKMREWHSSELIAIETYDWDKKQVIKDVS